MNSGATSPTTLVSNCFHLYKLIFPKNVNLGDNTILEVEGKGFVVVDIKVKGRVKKIAMEDVFNVSKLKANFLFLTHLVLKRLHVKFSDERSFVLLTSREEVAIIYEINDLYQIKFCTVHGAESVILVQSSSIEDKLALLGIIDLGI